MLESTCCGLYQMKKAIFYVMALLTEIFFQLFSIIINYDYLVSVLVSIFQITMGDNHMKRLFNPLFNTLFACQIFNIMKKMILLSILSIPFATMRGIQEDEQKFNEQVKEKYFDTIQRCVDNYVKNKKEILCETPLRKAAYAGDTECVNSFLDDFFQGEIDVDNRGKYKYGDTLLHIAARKGYRDMAEMLLNRGADPNIKSDTCGKTSLHFAADFRNTDTLNVLLKHNANVLTRDNFGMTAEDWINHDLQATWRGQSTHDYRQAEAEIRTILIQERKIQERKIQIQERLKQIQIQRLQINTNFGQ